MAGHLGAAVTAGYFFGEDHHDLDRRVHAAVEHDLDRIIQGEESFWYNQQKAGITVTELFAPFPEEEPHPDQIGTIATALSRNIGKTRQSGHNVIFASIAIRALHDHPRYATPAIIGGIVKLIDAFNGAVPGRGYYGRQRGWITGDEVRLPGDPGFAPYESEQAMTDVVLDSLIESGSLRRQGFGGLFHIINHAAGLRELSLCGYRDLASRGWAAHHHHVRLWRSLPDLEEELGALKRAEHDPCTPEYWADNQPSQWSARLTHRIKTLYGFYTLLRSVTDESRRDAAKAGFQYLMA
jgi:hypothetical protein